MSRKYQHVGDHKWSCECGWIGTSDQIIRKDGERNKCPSCLESGKFLLIGYSNRHVGVFMKEQPK